MGVNVIYRQNQSPVWTNGVCQGDIWMDTSQTPTVVRKWKGGRWRDAELSTGEQVLHAFDEAVSRGESLADVRRALVDVLEGATDDTNRTDKTNH